MKKISIILLSTMALVLTSCNMDKEPYNAIPDTEALTTATDFANMRVGLYSALRSSVGNQTFWISTEIQSDGFHAVEGFSNNLGNAYYWDFDSNYGNAATVYANYQIMISRANFILDGYAKADLSSFTTSELATVKKAVGDSYFIRAYSLLGLAQYFCVDYDESNADTPNLGVSYTTVYNPSSEGSSYPGRYTLRETFKQIYSDLESAEEYITNEGAPCDVYVSVDAILALRARAALACDDYETAYKAAEEIIEKGSFILDGTEDDLIDLWQQDGGNETILQMAVASRDELPDQVGQRFQPYQPGSVPDYVPTQTLINLYSDDDIRSKVYFNEIDITTNSGVSATVVGFNKFIDHGRLYDQFNGYEYARFVQEPKVFRIAEMYLIAAEAYAQAGDLVNAAKYLNELKSNRIEGYTEQSFASKDAFMLELQEERQREMVGEGQRLFDLKRWKKSMVRGIPQVEAICMLPGTSTTALVKQAGDNKFVWPIPKHETDVNLQIVQNPGY